MNRLLMSSVTAAFMLAAPLALGNQASAATAQVNPTIHRVAHHATRHHHRATRTAGTTSRRSGPRDVGSPAVDALNDQSLARARAGQ